jgi:hypothetical protein
VSLFDFLSGSDEAEQAAAANRAAATAAYGQQQDIQRQYQTGALGAIGQGLTSTVGALGTGLTNQTDAYNRALAASTAAGNAGVAAYSPLSNLGASYGRPVQLYQDALGVNGPEGAQRAQQSFITSPGYQFQVEQANKAAENKAASLGMAGSGNTLNAIAELTRGRAAGEYNNWLQGLQGFVNPQLQATAGAAGGVAGAQKTLADIANTGGSNLGGAYGTNAAQLAGYYTGAGEGQANVYGNVAGLGSQASRDLATGQMSANNLVAQAGMQNAANAWGAIGQGLGAIGRVATASDPRLKENKHKIGTLYDGQTVWAFNYVGDPTPRIGLMADEVEQRYPDAVIEHRGFKYVYYDRATAKARASAR